MKAARNFAAAAVLDGKLFVAGGATTRSKGLQTVECFDPETQTWAAAPAMPSFRRDMAQKVHVLLKNAGNIGGGVKGTRLDINLEPRSASPRVTPCSRAATCHLGHTSQEFEWCTQGSFAAGARQNQAAPPLGRSYDPAGCEKMHQWSHDNLDRKHHWSRPALRTNHLRLTPAWVPSCSWCDRPALPPSRRGGPLVKARSQHVRSGGTNPITPRLVAQEIVKALLSAKPHAGRSPRGQGHTSETARPRNRSSALLELLRNERRDEAVEAQLEWEVRVLVAEHRRRPERLHPGW